MHFWCDRDIPHHLRSMKCAFSWKIGYALILQKCWYVKMEKYGIWIIWQENARKVVRALWACKGKGCFKYINTKHNDMITTPNIKWKEHKIEFNNKLIMMTLIGKVIVLIGILSNICFRIQLFIYQISSSKWF